MKRTALSKKDKVTDRTKWPCDHDRVKLPPTSSSCRVLGLGTLRQLSLFSGFEHMQQINWGEVREATGKLEIGNC